MRKLNSQQFRLADNVRQRNNVNKTFIINKSYSIIMTILDNISSKQYTEIQDKC